MTEKDFIELLEYGLYIVRENERLKKGIARKEELINALQKENSKLKYEYEDSKLNRDNPLPYKWKHRGERLFMFCPKCEMSISNWQGYCHICGQKIGKGNPQPEMEVLDND